MAQTLKMRFREVTQRNILQNVFPDYNLGERVFVLYPLGGVVRGVIVSKLPEAHPYWGCAVYEIQTVRDRIFRPAREMSTFQI